jgi:hypothetical protein
VWTARALSPATGSPSKLRVAEAGASPNKKSHLWGDFFHY